MAEMLADDFKAIAARRRELAEEEAAVQARRADEPTLCACGRTMADTPTGFRCAWCAIHGNDATVYVGFGYVVAARR